MGIVYVTLHIEPAVWLFYRREPSERPFRVLHPVQIFGERLRCLRAFDERGVINFMGSTRDS